MHATSALAWQPGLSTLTWEEIAEVIARDTIVCSICCPDAPVELKESRDDTTCPGSGQAGKPGQGRQGYAYGNTLVCTECDAEIGVSANSYKVKKHPKPECKTLTKAEEKELKQALIEGEPGNGYLLPNTKGKSIKRISDAKGAISTWVEYTLSEYWGKDEMTVLNEYQFDIEALMEIIAKREGKFEKLGAKGGLRKKDHQLYAKIMKLNAQFIGQGKYPKGLETNN